MKKYLFILFLASVSLHLFSSDKGKINQHKILFKEKSGHTLAPGQTLQFSASLQSFSYPVKRKLRIVGGVKYPAPFDERNEETFRRISWLLDDCLDSTDAFKEKYSLILRGNNDSFERNVYYRLSRNEIQVGPAEINMAVKAEDLKYQSGNNLMVEIQMYFIKNGRHPDDIFDMPDSIVHLAIPPGTYGWQTIAKKLNIPQNIACILFRIGGKEFQGICKIGTPAFIQNKLKSPIVPFAPFRINQYKWVGNNLSVKEWPEFAIKINSKTIYSGKVFDRASEISEFEIDIPSDISGNHKIEIELLKQHPYSYPYSIKQVDLLEYGDRDFEVAFVPEFVKEKQNFAILININKAPLSLSFSASKSIRPETPSMHFEKNGLYAVKFHADSISISPAIRITDNKRSEEHTIRQVLWNTNDAVFISTSDDIYIKRDQEYFGRYLEWYCREGMGNSYVWRPSYQWSGTRDADPGFYHWGTSLMQNMNMYYALMIEGRCLPEINLNPDDRLMDSPFYMGRQSHENDGNFNYWGHFGWNDLYTDLMAKLRAPGGIFAKVRPIRTDKGNFVYQNSYCCSNMQEAAQTFVNNVRDAKGQSTRHTGPSTLFRYFFQAGYNWLGAEQMYGPEEITMSSLRGACKAYGKKDYGTHLATQWGSGPFDVPEHATRLFLSLAISYMHGASHINTEDGLWNTEDGKDRYTQAGKEHIQEQKKIYDFIQTHERRGTFVARTAILQGRNDGWRCFGRRGNSWAQKGDDWKFGMAEESFDLIRVFYPNNKLDAVYKFPCPNEEQGWYTGTPYGPVDLLPVEAPWDVIHSYKTLAFLGWNTFDESDFAKLLEFVQKGGTLILARPHMNTELNHGKPAILPESKLLEQLLGLKYSQTAGIIRRNVGMGKVVYFSQNLYPADSEIRKEYENELVTAGKQTILAERKKGWIDGNDIVEFSAYDWSGFRTIYLLNTDWWSRDTVHKVQLLLDKNSFPINVRRGMIELITIKDGIAVKPSSMYTDIKDIQVKEKEVVITLQCTEPDQLMVFSNKNQTTLKRQITEAGIHRIVITLK